jgi:hypothetical protein
VSPTLPGGAGLELSRGLAGGPYGAGAEADLALGYELAHPGTDAIELIASTHRRRAATVALRPRYQVQS